MLSKSRLFAADPAPRPTAGDIVRDLRARLAVETHLTLEEVRQEQRTRLAARTRS